MDTGADVSIVPLEGSKLTKRTLCPKLSAANGTSIATYGWTSEQIDIGLTKQFVWEFVVAKVDTAILGNDFLTYFDLVVDVRERRVVDKRSCFNFENQTKAKIAASCEVAAAVEGVKFEELLKEFEDLNEFSEVLPESMAGVCHHIETHGPPVFAKARRLDEVKLRIARAEFDDMLKKGVCRASKSTWSSPLHMVPKPNGQFRPCGNYRGLNAVTKPDRYPLPFITDFTAFLHGKRVFSVVDLRKAYHQVPIRAEDVEKTAIITPFGLFEFPRMTFGLRNAAQTFQRVMNQVLFGLDFVFAYIDDIFIASEDEELHKLHLRKVFERLREYGLSINSEKCIFGVSEIKFLGHLVSSEGIRLLPEKVRAISDFPKPNLAKELRRFLAMINFYRRFIPKAVEVQRVVQEMISGNVKNDNRVLEWTAESVQAFEDCKRQLANAALLAHPKFDAELALFTDASDFAVGAALNQRIEGEWQPLAFYSQKLNDAQLKYSAFDRELTAVFQAIKHFSEILIGRPFTVYTDHKPLTYAFHHRKKRGSPRQIRQLDFISQFSTSIVHVSGRENVVADTLSRESVVDWKDKLDFLSIAVAQEEDVELQNLVTLDADSSRFVKRNVPGSGKAIVGVLSSGKFRPFIPSQFRELVLTKMHGVAHPGIKGTASLVKDRFFWPKIQRDCAEFVKVCIACQRSKVGRHTKSPLGSYQLATERFQHVNVDIVGRLPSSRGFEYVLTCIDRFTRWPVAIPMSNMTAETVARSFISGWVSHYGVPHRISTDLGRQFESDLFGELTKLLGIHHLRTTPYHPQSNGMIERWHRTVKAAIRCHTNENWADFLPLVMLGLRSVIKEVAGASAAELLYGTTLRLPGEFFEECKEVKLKSDFAVTLRGQMRKIRPVPTKAHRVQRPFIHPALSTCTHVFIRHDAVHPSLQMPFDGPFKVIKRQEKYFDLDLHTRRAKVSIDRLKPAFLPNEVEHGSHSTIILPHEPAQRRISNQDEREIPATSTSTLRPATRRVHFSPIVHQPYRTRSGRLIRRPRRPGTIFY